MVEKLLTIKEAATFLGVSPTHIYRVTRQEQLPVVRRGMRYTRYPKSDLVAFLDRYTAKEGGQR
ncbi:helix-turn-helix domain-containing protein [Chloroflexota bacterium]